MENIERRPFISNRNRQVGSQYENRQFLQDAIAFISALNAEGMTSPELRKLYPDLNVQRIAHVMARLADDGYCVRKARDASGKRKKNSHVWFPTSDRDNRLSDLKTKLEGAMKRLRHGA